MAAAAASTSAGTRIALGVVAVACVLHWLLYSIGQSLESCSSSGADHPGLVTDTDTARHDHEKMMQEEMKRERCASARLSSASAPASAFVGVFSPPGHAGVRSALRDTWFPQSRHERQVFEDRFGVVLRFVVQDTQHHEEGSSAAVEQEQAEYGDIMAISVPAQGSGGGKGGSVKSRLTLEFFRLAARRFQAKFYVKVEETTYLHPHRLGYVMGLMEQESSAAAQAWYIGCMEKGNFPKKGHPLRDKDLDLLGTSSFPAHARGDAFALSRQVVLDLSTVADVNPRGLRMFTDESISVGSWMLALNVTFVDDRRFCHEQCSFNSIAVPLGAALSSSADRILSLGRTAECGHIGDPSEWKLEDSDAKLSRDNKSWRDGPGA